MNNKYIVKEGDSLWKIAHDNGLSLKDILSYNNKFLKGNINTVIHPGDEIRLIPVLKHYKYVFENIDDISKREKEANTDNLKAILASTHSNNYIVLDKKKGLITVYSPNNEKLYSAKTVTGLSRNDYNTITYVSDSNELIDNAGNNSTPAGITAISGIGSYHGFPSFTRARLDKKGKIKKVKDRKGNFINDDIASAIHFGHIRPGIGSNGCVRVSGKDLTNINNLITKGTKVYTLPEKPGSRFEVRLGKLNYFANNPYGELTGSKRYWDDYNTYSDTTYSPLVITDTQYRDDPLYNANVAEFSRAIMQSKRVLLKYFNIDSQTYDKMAKVAMGMAELESKFNTAYRKTVKNNTPDWLLKQYQKVNEVFGSNSFSTFFDRLGKIFDNDKRYLSRGITQMKIKGDGKDMLKVYKDFGINEYNIDKDAFTSGLATMARLLYIYNTEIRGRKFKGKGDIDITPEEAVLYKWNGRNMRLRSGAAEPYKNEYIQNVKKYSNRFNLESGRLVEHEE